MKKIFILSVILVFLVITRQGQGNIIYIPTSYSTIQAGINASANGDTLIVDPGTYFEHIDLNGMNIVLGSWFITTGDTSFISSTIIDGSSTGRVMTISQGEDSTCRIVGFTLQHGYAPSVLNQIYGGGGIFILESSPRILNCIIQNNYSPDFGGGICLVGSAASAKVINCTIKNNTANSFGGGVFMGDCSGDAAIVNSTISGNSITCNCEWNGGGGGVNLYHTGKLINCLISNNSAPNALIGGGGVHCDWGDPVSHAILVIGCTIANNTAADRGGVSYVVEGGEFRNCIIWGNTDQYGNVSNYDGNLFENCCTTPLPVGAGNISSNPNFTDSITGNFRLLAGSPCINTGNNAFNDQPTDLDGNIRVFNSIIDMGAFEKGAGAGVTVQVGSGTETSVLFPVHSYYGYNYSQQIYLGSEITSGGGGSGIITKIRFYYSSGSPDFSKWNNWTVYLGNTSKAEFASDFDWIPLASMTQVFSGIIPDPVAENWFEITLPAPFYYNGNNIVVAVDENSPGWDSPPAQFRSFSTGANRGLIYFDDDLNPDPAIPPLGFTTLDNIIAQIQFQIDMTSNPFAPPAGLQASLSGPMLNNVHLSWMPPGSVADQWIYWGDGSIIGALGYGGPAIFSVASRWPVADIAQYDGAYLKKIRFSVAEVTATYTLKVWKGADAGTLLLSQAIVNPYIGSWNEVTLNTPILIDGTEELWFGYEVVQSTGYPAGLSSGPAIAGKGDMINAGYGWFSMKNSWNYDFNWTLQGFVSESALLAPQKLMQSAENTMPGPAVGTPAPVLGKPLIVLNNPIPSASRQSGQVATDQAQPGATKQQPGLSLGVFTGYNVYRDNFKIGNNIPDLFYDDLALAPGGYDYQVSAQYDLGESDRIGPLHVDIYTCFPPTNVAVSNSTLTTTTADVSWTPSAYSVNPEWTIEWVQKDFPQGTGTTAHVTSTPAYSLTNLLPGYEYDLYVSTYCSETDASAWVKKTFRTHYFDCPAGAVPEAEVCGTNTNGCDLVPPAFGTIACGDTICGTAWLERSYRDSDWYSLVLTEPNDVTLTAQAEFYNFIGIGTAMCPSTLYYSSMTNGAGYTSSITAQLGAAGPYFVKIAPEFAEQVECDSLSRYWIKLTCNPCLSPTALTATNITSTSATLGWTSGGSLWNIEWGTYGFTQGSGTMITGIPSNPYILTGLTMGNYYSYYVKSDCGGGSISNWSGPYTFYLPCPAITLPYTEDFIMTTGITPQCWQVRNSGAPTNWIVEMNNYAGGAFPQLEYKPYNPYFNGRSYLMSPVINTTGVASLDLSFKHYINAYTSTSSCEIWTTSNGGTTWNPVWANAQTGIVGPESTTMLFATPDVGSPTFQFAFAVGGNSWEIGTWQIDDITLTDPAAPPTTNAIQNVTVLNGQIPCYDATQTITVAGSGTTFIVENGGITTMIAGISIDYLPGTWVKPGGYMLGKIAPTGPFCGAPPASFVTAEVAEGETSPPFNDEKSGVRVYPNPTNGKFRVELTGKLPTGSVRVEIYSIRGERVLSTTLPGEAAGEFSLSDRPAGIYFIKVIAGENIFTSKLVKTN